MWVSWWTKRGLGRFFSGFLPFFPATNFIPPFLHTHLIHLVSFHQPLWWCVRRGRPAPLLFTDLQYRGFIASHPSTRPCVGNELRIFYFMCIYMKLYTLYYHTIAASTQSFNNTFTSGAIQFKLTCTFFPNKTTRYSEISTFLPHTEGIRCFPPKSSYRLLCNTCFLLSVKYIRMSSNASLKRTSQKNKIPLIELDFILWQVALESVDLLNNACSSFLWDEKEKMLFSF